MSLLSTDFDFRANADLGKQEINFRTDGYWLKDQIEPDNNEFRLKRAYVEYLHRGSGIDVLLGRQKQFDSGMYTSFDGATIKYPLRKNLTLASSFGKPQYFADIYDKLNYQFYSANADWEINGSNRLNLYFNTQTLDGVTDREALGFQSQFISEKFYSSINVDYDLAFSELNNFLFSGNYNFNKSNSLSLTLGYQRSPFLSATNILIGQVDLDLELYLKSKENRDSLIEDALARTSLSQYYSLSYSTELDEHANLILDYYHSALTQIPSPDFLAGLDPDNTTMDFQQNSVGARVVFQKAFYGDDIATLGVRQTSGDTSSSSQIYFSEKLRFGNTLYINPKATYAKLQFDNGNSDQQQIRYALLLTYKPQRRLELSLEAGNENISIQQSRNSFDSKYLFIGARIVF